MPTHLVLVLLLALLSFPQGVPAGHLDPEVAGEPRASRPRPEDSRPARAFAEFETAVTVQGDGFEEVARFTLEAGLERLDPLAEDLSFSVGTFAVTLPAGALVRRPAAAPGQGARFVFQGSIAGTWLDVRLAEVSPRRFELRVEGRGEAAIEIIRPEFVTLRLGNHAGSTVSARVSQES